MNSLVAQNAPLSQVVETAKSSMEKLAAQEGRIGPPYRYLTVTAQGVHAV